MQSIRQRDDRRRRVLADEISSASDTLTDAATDADLEKSPPRRRAEPAKYGDTAFVRGQPRLSDLVPQSYLSIALILIAGLACIAGLESLYSFMPYLAAKLGKDRIAAIDLESGSSIADWLASMMLVLASLVSLLIFSVRRHKTDDYHGRYRVWLWASLLWLLMSVDEIGILHQGFNDLMSHVSGTRITGDGSLWWVLGYGLLWLAVASRLFLQMRTCRLAACAFVAVALCYGAAVAVHLGWLSFPNAARQVMAEEGLELTGNLSLLITALLFARYAILESRGQIVSKDARKRTRARRPATAPASGESNGQQTAASHASSAAANSARPDSPLKLGSASAGSHFRVDSAHLTANRRLSKAERRAIRKQSADRS